MQSVKANMDGHKISSDENEQSDSDNSEIDDMMPIS